MSLITTLDHVFVAASDDAPAAGGGHQNRRGQRIPPRRGFVVDGNADYRSGPATPFQARRGASG